MTDAEIFERFVKAKGLGSRFHRDLVSPEYWDRTYAHVTNWAKHLIDDARKFVQKLPPIHFDFIYNPEVNAWAFKDEGCYFIGITTGTMFMMDFLFFRMLSDARLFPEIGNPKAEQGSFPPLPNYTTNAQEMARAKTIFGGCMQSA
jgi:hypothetical protein